MSQRHTVWLHADDHYLDPETRAVLGDGPIITLSETAPTDALDREIDHEVFMDSDLVVRAAAAERAYRAVQDELRAAYASAEATQAVLEQAVEEAEGREWDEQYAIDKAAAAIAEAEAEAEHGPREWFMVALRGWRGRYRDQAYTVGYTVHREGCRVLERYRKNHDGLLWGDGADKGERFPTAVQWVTKQRWYNDPPVKACRVCAGRLIEETTPTAEEIAAAGGES